MHIVKQRKTNQIVASPSTQLDEYLMKDKDMSGATAMITGRYPTKGFAVNTVSKELALVIRGEGTITTDTEEASIEIGDCIIIPANEKFFWKGNLTLFLVCTPAFDASQHIITDNHS
jgi:mannose-6-phosphate isomerase-like protein (cupin superfamily)